jgi:predicted nucleotidyltransferase
VDVLGSYDIITGHSPHLTDLDQLINFSSDLDIRELGDLENRLQLPTQKKLVELSVETSFADYSNYLIKL